ncbi:lysoplasmalogenase [Tenacibaculum maritimum]|nr:lysoplasmalogenase [Tenacibaculum maritimum]
MKIKRDLTDSIVKSLIKVAVLLNSLTFSVASFGLGAFLIAHFMYIKMTASFLKIISKRKLIKAAIPFITFFGTILFFISANLGNMLVPVIIYGLAISAFGTCALLNYKEQKSLENSWLLLGALLFIASDSMIALNNFYTPKHLFDILIITLYVVSQYLIVKAIVAKSG